jgi:ribose transport system substrate-binding protein
MGTKSWRLTWRVGLIAAVVACAALLVVAAPGGATASGGASKPVHIAFLNEAITTYTTPMVNAMKSTATRLHATVAAFNANNDPSTQESQCQDALTSGKYNAMVIYSVDNAAAAPCARQAIAAHVPIVPVDNTVGPSPTSLAIQVNGIKAQVLGDTLVYDVPDTVDLVKKACSHFAKPCTVVMTESIPNYTFCSYKLSHEQPLIKKLGIDVIATLVVGNFDDPDGMRTAIENELVKSHKIDVILSDDDSSVQGAIQMKKQGKLPNTLIIGDGGNAPAIQAIRQGLEFGTIYDTPATEGIDSVTDAAALVRGQPIAHPIIAAPQLSPYFELTKQGVGNVKAQW